MADFLSSVLKGVMAGEQLSLQHQQMQLQRERADRDKQAFDLHQGEVAATKAEKQAEKDFAVDAMQIQGRIGKEGSADAGPPTPALTEDDALSQMAKSASRFGLSQRAFDLSTKAGVKRDAHRLMGAVLGGDLKPMFERLGSFGMGAEEGADPATGKPFIRVKRQDGTEKVLPFESRDHMLGSMAALLEGKYIDFALNMAKSSQGQDTKLQQLYMNSILKGADLDRRIAETNARIDGTWNGGRGGSGGGKKKGSGKGDGTEQPYLYGEGVDDQEKLDKTLKARIPDDAQINLRNEKATEPVSPFEFRNRVADHVNKLALGAPAQRDIGELLPIAEELARNEFVEKQAGAQPPDAAGYQRVTEYDGKAGVWRQKIVTPTGDSFLYGRPGVDPTKFGLPPEKIAAANLQKAEFEYDTLLAFTRPENSVARQRMIAEQFGGDEASFRGELAMAQGRVRELQAQREAHAQNQREVSRAAVVPKPSDTAKTAGSAPAFDQEQLKAASALGVTARGKPATFMDDIAKPLWGATSSAVKGTYFTMNEALFDRNVREIRETGRMRIMNADALRRAIAGDPALKKLLTKDEVAALEVAINRKLP
ncbi:MAG: hypothetical protein ABIF28_09315 [Pseudomonadota bacterium]